MEYRSVHSGNLDCRSSDYSPFEFRCCLFNDGHVLQLLYFQRPSPPIDGLYLIWMIYDGYMKTGDGCGSNFLTFVLRLRESHGKTFNQETDPTGDRTRARCMRSNDVTLGFRFREQTVLESTQPLIK